MYVVFRGDLSTKYNASFFRHRTVGDNEENKDKTFHKEGPSLELSPWRGNLRSSESGSKVHTGCQPTHCIRKVTASQREASQSTALLPSPL